MIRACGNWVLIEADPQVKQTAGGIIIPDNITMVERMMEGTGRVRSVGGKVPGPETLHGARVAYRGFLKDAWKVDKNIEGSDIFFLHWKDILGVVDDDNVRVMA